MARRRATPAIGLPSGHARQHPARRDARRTSVNPRPAGSLSLLTSVWARAGAGLDRLRFRPPEGGESGPLRSSCRVSPIRCISPPGREQRRPWPPRGGSAPARIAADTGHHHDVDARPEVVDREAPAIALTRSVGLVGAMYSRATSTTGGRSSTIAFSLGKVLVATIE